MLTATTHSYEILATNESSTNVNSSSTVCPVRSHSVTIPSRATTQSITNIPTVILDHIMTFTCDSFAMARVNRNFHRTYQKQIIPLIAEIVDKQLKINNPFNSLPTFEKVELQKNLYQGFQLLRCYYLYWTACHLKHQTDFSAILASPSNPTHQVLQQNISILPKAFILTMKIPWQEESLPFQQITYTGSFKLSEAITKLRTAILDTNLTKIGYIHTIATPTLQNKLLRDLFDTIYVLTMSHKLLPPLTQAKAVLNASTPLERFEPRELQYAICILIDYLLRRLDIFVHENYKRLSHRNDAIRLLHQLFKEFTYKKTESDCQDLSKALINLDSEVQHEIRKRDMQSNEYIANNCLMSHSEERLGKLYKDNRAFIAKIINSFQDIYLLPIREHRSEYMPAIQAWLLRNDKSDFPESNPEKVPETGCCILM